MVMPYRFGSQTADYLVCRVCGVYIGAVCTTETGPRAVININSLVDRALFTGVAAPVDHDGEMTAARIGRRATTWTQAVLHR